MGLASFQEFDASDLRAFVASVAIGFLAGSFVPAGPTAIYVGVLVSYHVFLVWLIFFSIGHKRAGVSFPVVQTLLTHVACVLLVMSPIVTAVARHIIVAPGTVVVEDPDSPMAAMETMERQRGVMRLVQAVCGAMAGLAVFERRWLFSSEKTEKRPAQELQGQAAIPAAPGQAALPAGANQAAPAQATAIAAAAIQATAEDAAAWNRYLAQRGPGAYKAGRSLKAEYEQWLVERYKRRAAVDAGGSRV